MRCSRIVLVMMLASLHACALVRPEPTYEGPPIELFAVLPVEGAAAARPAGMPLAADQEALDPEAGMVVTAQIYGVMAESSGWRFVPDLTIAAAMRDLPREGTLEQRALALGKAVDADGVLYGTVYRFQERQGGDFGAREPASVSFRLGLFVLEAGETVWTGDFDQTQQSLSSNLFRWWQFWRAGPRWFTVRELTRLGVEDLLEKLRRFLG